jgi:NADH-ubiquinone oxidoreductase chain 4
MAKGIFLFFFFLLFGWFNYLFFFVFSFFLFFVLVFFFYDFSFGGFVFGDSLGFSLLLLTFFIYICCYFTSLLEKWVSNGFFSFSFFLSLIYFLLFIGFSLFSFVGFYVCFEFIFMAMFLFLLGWGYRPERLQASFYIVFYTIVVSLPFLLFLLFSSSDFFVFKFLFLGTYSFY